MKKAVIFDAARRAALETFLPDAAAKVTAAGDAVRASFPALTWNTLFVWVLCCEKAAADDLCRRVLEDAERLEGHGVLRGDLAGRQSGADAVR